MDRLGASGSAVHIHVRANRQMGSPAEQRPRPGRQPPIFWERRAATRETEEDRVDPGSEANFVRTGVERGVVAFQ